MCVHLNEFFQEIKSQAFVNSSDAEGGEDIAADLNFGAPINPKDPFAMQVGNQVFFVGVQDKILIFLFVTCSTPCSAENIIIA